jgi:hypothetical protein
MRNYAYQYQQRFKHLREVREYQLEILCITCPLKVYLIGPGTFIKTDRSIQSD